MAVVVAASCGAADDSGDAAFSASGGGEDDRLVDVSSTTTTVLIPSLTGSFEGVSGDRTVELAFEIGDVRLTTNFEDAPVGEVIVTPTGIGSVTLTNTTPNRTASLRFWFGASVSPQWREADHGSLFGPRNCAFEFRGVDYCGAGYFQFELFDDAGVLELPSGGSVSAPLVAGLSASDAEVPEATIGDLVGLFEGERPDLILVTFDAFATACYDGIAQFNAILDGNGAVLHARPSTGFGGSDCSRV